MKSMIWICLYFPAKRCLIPWEAGDKQTIRLSMLVSRSSEHIEILCFRFPAQTNRSMAHRVLWNAFRTPPPHSVLKPKQCPHKTKHWKRTESELIENPENPDLGLRGSEGPCVTTTKQTVNVTSPVGHIFLSIFH